MLSQRVKKKEADTISCFKGLTMREEGKKDIEKYWWLNDLLS